MKKNNKKYKKSYKKKKHPFLKLFLLLMLLISVIFITYFVYGTIRNGGGLKGFLSTVVGETSEEIDNLEPISAFLFINLC